MKIDKNYKDYFKNQYKLSFTEQDIYNYKKWFLSQYIFINKFINIKSTSKILEIGSAFGGFYNILTERQRKNYIGLELDNDAVLFSNNFFKVDCFKNKSILDYDEHGKKDFVFAFEVLEHFDDPIKEIGKIYETLNSNGIFCGTTPYPFKKNIEGDYTHYFVLHPLNWEKLFYHIGFSEVKTKPMSFIPFIWRIWPFFNIKLPFYIPFKYFISTSLIIAKK